MDNGTNRTTPIVKFRSRLWTILVEILNFVSLLFIYFLKRLNNSSGPFALLFFASCRFLSHWQWKGECRFEGFLPFLFEYSCQRELCLSFVLLLLIFVLFPLLSTSFPLPFSLPAFCLSGNGRANALLSASYLFSPSMIVVRLMGSTMGPTY